MDNTAEEPVANESTAINSHCDITIECMGNAAVKQTLRKQVELKCGNGGAKKPLEPFYGS